jgi:molybdenum cofactor biosynthesis enzyme MoaA
LVRLIQKECASALEDIDNEKLQIRIDSLDRKTFEQINQLIDTLSKVRETNGDNIGKKLKV